MSLNDRARETEIEPSLYGADMSRLGEQVDVLLAAGARVFHFDMGDGHFVPPVTMGPIVLKWISGRVRDAGGWMDCHLMTEAPERHFKELAEAGADSVTVHLEACEDVADVFSLARDQGLGAGLGFNPESTPESAAEAAQGADLVLCMSINPGYSGQAFMPESIERIRRLRELLPADVRIQVDGGVGADNVNDLRRAGASLLVAATSIFGHGDPASAYRELTQAAG